MKRSIKELRLARGLSQTDLAREMKIGRDLLSKIESKDRGASDEVVQAICSILKCSPAEVDVRAPKASGGQARLELVTRFRAEPERAPRPEWTSARRLEALRADLPGFMRQFDTAKWDDFLADVPSEARDETIVQLRELRVGAATAEVSTNYLGFSHWPVVDDFGRGASHLLRPALVTKDFIMVFQIPVLTPKPYRMDALVLVKEPVPTFIDLEIDDKWHVPELDAERARAIGLYTIRIPSSEVLKGPTVAERLRAHGFCLPRDL